MTIDPDSPEAIGVNEETVREFGEFKVIKDLPTGDFREEIIEEIDPVAAIPRSPANTPQEDRMIAILRNAIAWCFYGDDTREVIDLPQEDIDRCQAVAERCVADLQEDKLERQKQSNLVQHARYELELIGEEPETIDWYCDTVLAFASYGHGGGSAAVSVPILYKLLSFQHLNELTDDPDEWVQHEEKLWQNRRNGEAFSLDGGKTYYLLSESSGKRVKWHKSKHKGHKGLEELSNEGPA